MELRYEACVRCRSPMDSISRQPSKRRPALLPAGGRPPVPPAPRPLQEAGGGGGSLYSSRHAHPLPFMVAATPIRASASTAAARQGAKSYFVPNSDQHAVDLLRTRPVTARGHRWTSQRRAQQDGYAIAHFLYVDTSYVVATNTAPVEQRVERGVGPDFGAPLVPLLGAKCVARMNQVLRATIAVRRSENVSWAGHKWRVSSKGSLRESEDGQRAAQAAQSCGP